MFFSFCKDTKKKKSQFFPIFFHIEKRQAMNKSHCRAGYLRSFSISSGVFLPYFSHPEWEKYGRNMGEVTLKERIWNLDGKKKRSRKGLFTCLLLSGGS